MLLPHETLEQEREATTVAPPSTLDDVIDAVMRDSRVAPGEYLDETVVPHGGE